MSSPTDRLEHAEYLLDELESVEAKLRRLQEGLTRSHRLATMGTMVSILAHEFNNILTPIISYCQLAQRSPDDEELVHKALERSLKGAERAARISGSVLGFARDPDDAGECEVAEVVDEVFGCLGREPKRDGIVLRLRVAEGCRAVIPPVDLQQVLLNLVLNAREAMRRKGGALEIAAAVQDNRVVIDVTDTGPGIDPDLLPRVFEPFVSNRESAGSTDPPGTGLGLTVCRDLIHQAEGTITISRSDATGTTFQIDLPRGA